MDSRFPSPEHNHHLGVAPYDPDPGSYPVKGVICPCANLTFGFVITQHIPPPLTLHPLLRPLSFFSFTGSTDGFVEFRSTRRIRICCLATSRDRRMVPWHDQSGQRNLLLSSCGDCTRACWHSFSSSLVAAFLLFFPVPPPASAPVSLSLLVLVGVLGYTTLLPMLISYSEFSPKILSLSAVFCLPNDSTQPRSRSGEVNRENYIGRTRLSQPSSTSPTVVLSEKHALTGSNPTTRTSLHRSRYLRRRRGKKGSRVEKSRPGLEVA